MSTDVSGVCLPDRASVPSWHPEATGRELVDGPPIPFTAPKRVPRGKLLVLAGESAASVYLVRRGQFRIFLIDDDGQETVTAVVGPGQIVGIAPLIGLPVYHACVQALESAEVWVLPAGRLRQAMTQDAELALTICTALVRRLAFAEALVRDLALLPVTDRIPDVLGRLGGYLGGEPGRLTRQLVAALVGARRETVSRAVHNGRPQPAARQPATQQPAA